MELFKRLTKFGPLRKIARPAEFKPSASSMKVYQAVIPNKVALIDRLPSKYHQEAQRAVWSAVMRGYDVVGLARELEDRFGIAPERARLVAAAQCKMARSVIENAQNIEMGITEAVWRYDREHCGVPIHQALHGRKYPLARGADLEGKRTWPSGEPGCTCTSSAVNAQAEEDDAA